MNRFEGTWIANLSKSKRNPTSVPGIPLAAHTFATPQDMIAEVIDARVYSGFHYRTSGIHGTVIGKKVADWVSSHYFLRVK